MRSTLAGLLMAVALAIGSASADTSVKITDQNGTVLDDSLYELNVDIDVILLEPSATEPPPPPTEPPDPVLREAFLEYPRTKPRPWWCDTDQHYCMSADAGSVPYNIIDKVYKPLQDKWMKPEERVAVGEECRSSMFFQKGITGIMVKIGAYVFCQPMPRDGSSELRIQFEPGKVHRGLPTAYVALPTVWSAPRAVVAKVLPPKERPEGYTDERPIINCINAAIAGNSTTQSQACAGGRASTGYTMKGLVVLAGIRNDDGSLTLRPRAAGNHACIRGINHDVTVEDSDLLGCRMGVQGSGSGDWTITRTFVDGGIAGTSAAHALYMDYRDGGASMHVADSVVHTCGSNVVKTGAKNTLIERSILEEGKEERCNTGRALDNYAGGDVVMNDVIVRQFGEAGGNILISTSGTEVVNRCINDSNGDGVGDSGSIAMKNVTIEDTVKTVNRRHKSLCPGLPTVWRDNGGNTYNGEPMFSERDGVVRAYTTQPPE